MHCAQTKNHITMEKIVIENNILKVPYHPTIPYIEGDGIGKEITQAVKRIIDKAVSVTYNEARSINWMEVLAGGKAHTETGNWLPDPTMNAFREYLVGIKGPLMTPVGGGIRSLNVALRQELDLYVCERPVRWYKGVETPIKHPEKVNMTIFRENTEDIYAGIEWNAQSDDAVKIIHFLQNEMGVNKIRFPESSSIGVKPVSKEGSERLVKAAIEYAIRNKKPSVTIVHKGNIMKFTEGGFKKWGYELAEKEFGDKVFTAESIERIKKGEGPEKAQEIKQQNIAKGKIFVNDVIADAFLQNTLLKPEEYSVIATLNLNGDYISDQLAAMVGGIGIAPGANINYQTGHAIFEATHGTAPDIAGENKANPCSMLLSGVMMLEYMGWNEAGAKINKALEELFSENYATYDLARFMENGKPLSTTEFSEKIIDRLN